MAIIQDRFPHWNEYQVTTMALMMELMVALNIYGGPTVVTEAVDPPPPEKKPGWMDEDDDEEEWKR